MSTASRRTSVIIVNYFSAQKTARAVQSVLAQTPFPVEIVLVDNSCAPEEFEQLQATVDELKSQTEIRLVRAPKNGGAGYGNNRGAEVAQGDYLFFLNPDAVLVNDCIGPLVSWLEREPKLGSIGCVVVDEDGQSADPGDDFNGIGRSLRWGKHVLVSAFGRASAARAAAAERRKAEGSIGARGLWYMEYVLGAALMMRRRDFERLNGQDESFFMYSTEVDLQYRLLHDLGLRAAVDPQLRVLHTGGGTVGSSTRRRVMLEQGCLQFVRKHRSLPYVLAYKLITVGVIALEGALLGWREGKTMGESMQLFKTVLKN
jgi:hypothetical protein